MESVVCLNCTGKGHFSESCPLPQKFTRCPGCNRVVSKPAGHANGCNHRNFTSVAIVIGSGFALNVPVFFIRTINKNGSWSMFGKPFNKQSPKAVIRRVAATAEITGKNALLISCETGSRVSLLVCDEDHVPLIFINANHTSISVNNYWTAH